MSNFSSVLYSILGQRIKERRIEVGLSQNELAEKVSILYPLKRSSISNIERGKQQPPLHLIYEICRNLEVDIQVILPTKNDVQKILDKNKERDVEVIFESMNLDNATRKIIEDILKKSKK